jgi:hypothetical protein
MPRLSRAVALDLVDRAFRRFVDSGRYENPVAIGLGRRRKQGRWVRQHTLTVFVRRKPRKGKKLEDRPLPKGVAVKVGKRNRQIAIDVVEVGRARGKFRTELSYTSSIATSGDGHDGWISWLGRGSNLAVTAAHVVRFKQGARLFCDAQAVGFVSRLAYDSARVDAALIALDEGVDEFFSSRAFPNVANPRYVSQADVHPNAASARAYVPSSEAVLDVQLRYVHVAGLFSFQQGGKSYRPESLILADPCAVQGGDSGTPLFSLSGEPIGLLTGSVQVEQDGSTVDYTAFTELGAALDGLDVAW